MGQFPGSRRFAERRMVELTKRLEKARQELAVTEQQLAALSDDADDARVRSLVSESPLAHKEHRDAARQAEAMASARDRQRAAVQRLESELGKLFDKLLPGTRG